MESNALKDILYDKSYECPVCYHPFTSKAIRLNTNKAVSSDLDLYPRYSHVNPLLYDAILCPKCGYCALNKNFSQLLPTQIQWIKEQVTSKYKKRSFGTYMSLQDALIKHQLALICCLAKKGKFGEQGFIALHIAWLYRDLKKEEQEKAFLEKAASALMKALESETFPVFHLDATTTSYIIAAIHYQLGHFDLARDYLNTIVHTAKGQLKNRVFDLKELIKTARTTS